MFIFLKKLMSSEDHATRIHKLHVRAGAVLTKVTHAQRYTTALLMRSHGTPKEESRAMGWSCGDSYNSVYDREVPFEALLGAAMYNARKPENHFCARESLRMFAYIPNQISL